MLTRFNRVVVSLALVSGFVVLACERVPLLAPTGSTIVLTAGNTALPTNTALPIVAQVAESSGTPPHSGTRINFTTSLGTIEPSSAGTDVNGQVTVIFRAGASSGTATISAFSGSATTGTTGALKIAIGTAAVGRVTVNASPATVPAVGGQTTITANVLDINGNPLSSTPVVFTSTAGQFQSPSTVATNADGVSAIVLFTGQQAVVTASVGATAPSTGTGTGGTTAAGQASGSVTITVASAPTIIIGLPSTPPSVGVPATFTFSITPAASGGAVRNAVVDWGDGDRSTLGAVTGSQSASHTYSTAGSKLIAATVTDASNNTTSVSTSVTVIPVPRPSIIVTPTPQTVVIGGTITVNILVTVPSGIGIVRTTINFGDGETRDLGGASTASVRKQYATTGSRTITVLVLDTTGQVTEGTADVSVTP